MAQAMTLDNKNYHSARANKMYMSTSQFKTFLSCPARAVAETKGKYNREETEALLVGSYVDSYFSGELEQFKEEHPQIMTKGQLKAPYKSADLMIKRIEQDKTFMKYLEGDKQTILTGEIGGVMFKAKLDVLHPKRIVDLKTTKTFEPVWNDAVQERQSFIQAWGYDLQGAIYQELVRLNTGQSLPFIIAAITKEKVPDIELFLVEDCILQEAMMIIENKAAEFAEMKAGLRTAPRCEKCDYCKQTKKLKNPVSIREYFELSQDFEIEEVEE